MMKKVMNYISLIPAILFVLTIGTMVVKNYPYMKENFENLRWTEAEDFTDNFEANLKENLAEKRELIDLNGGMSKVLGINLLNQRQRMRNGYLSVLGGYIPTVDTADAVTGIASFFEEEGIEYLYLLAPSKAYFYEAPFAPGYENPGHNSLVEMTNAMEAAGVRYMDMDTWFAKNGWTMEDVYFRTDHHWRPEAAFAAVQQVMKRLAENGTAVYDEASLDLNNWNVEVYEDYWLGSDGQRTGKYYAGLDDLSYIYPKFETEVSFSNLWYHGMSYRDSVYYPEFIAQPDYELAHSYYVYLGENYPLAYINNPKAVNDQKVIVVGDSYRLPFEAFLTTQFTEIYHIDLRKYECGNFVEFVKQIQPDKVLMVYNGPTYGDGSGQYNFGLEEWRESFEGALPKETLLIRNEIVVPERENSENYQVVYSNLKSGAYEMSFGNAVVSRNAEISEKAPGSYVQAAVLNLKNGEIIRSRYIHTDREEIQKWFFTVPEDDDASYAVVLYGGTYPDTEGVTATVTEVQLTSYEKTES